LVFAARLDEEVKRRREVKEKKWRQGERKRKRLSASAHPNVAYQRIHPAVTFLHPSSVELSSVLVACKAHPQSHQQCIR
jgi:hypothetical protein